MPHLLPLPEFLAHYSLEDLLHERQYLLSIKEASDHYCNLKTSAHLAFQIELMDLIIKVKEEPSNGT